MRFWVVEIETTSGGTAKQITEKATKDEAKSLFYQILASVYANTAITYSLVMLVNENGFVEIMDRHVSEVEEETPVIA